ncbi:hypothetical protein BBD42_04985 [Paenibacillus sp. BIHB 4019]|uniref:HAMP domain-containing protein n=1 Tax=Paenibacillus sp. BIHB 4019 TaxID=1870819 RepID=A0A1B2DDV2_9BACL|nr:sensor histidine kinase [Paenibacillus sp. BIHB 4019]ANY65894.1 hypothetical protein BBD42_04985 [Paenibacillus sp. BIHB 4019]
MKWFKRYKLQPTLVIVSSLVILLLLAVQAVIVYYSTSQLMSAKISDASLSQLEQTNESLTQQMQSIRSLALSIVINQNVIRILEDGRWGADIYQQIRSNESITDLLSNTAYSRSDISEIIIITDRMSIYNYSNPNGIYEQERMKDKPYWDYMSSRTEGFLPPRANDVRIDGAGAHIITYFHKIFSSDGKALGYVNINLQFDHFSSALTNLPQQNQTYIVDDQSGIHGVNLQKSTDDQDDTIAQIEQQGGLQGAASAASGQGYTVIDIGGQKYLSMFTRPNEFGWRIAQLKPYAEVVAGIPQIMNRVMIASILCLSLGIVILVFFSRSITNPLKRLIQQMNKVGKGNFDITLDTDYMNEIGELNQRFMIMSSKIKDLMHSIEEEQRQLRESELKALQSQINPHFLYNTLDAINWMAIKIRADDISRMTSALGDFFRLSLNKGRSQTTIKLELEHLRAYIHLMSFRYSYRFTYDEEVDEELLSAETVKIILQPLVENSLVHGFAATKGAGALNLRVWREGEDIVFVLTDDGIGVNVEQMNASLKNAVVQDAEQTGGYGVVNVNQRIKMHDGSAYGLTYLHTKRGTAVEVRIRAARSYNYTASGEVIQHVEHADR